MIPDYLNYFAPFYCVPIVHDNFKKPPRLYDLMESIVNYGKTDNEKIKNLAKYARTTIFDFDYPLSSNINRADFEIKILNHFITRRIGFETFTIFQIQLDTKLNEIMPMYNKMFDALENWNIFNDGEMTERTGEDNRLTNSQSDTSNLMENTSNTTADRRFSDTPQNNIQEVQAGEYITNYNYDQMQDSSNSKATSNNFTNTKDDNLYYEIIKKTNTNKIEILKEMQENIQSIYTLIYKDLNDLFYGLD